MAIRSAAGRDEETLEHGAARAQRGS